MLHHFYAQWCAFDRYARTHNQLDGFILQYFFFTTSQFRCRIFFSKSRHKVRFFSIKRYQLPAASCHSVYHSINMVVIDVDDREPNLGFGYQLFCLRSKWKRRKQSHTCCCLRRIFHKSAAVE